MLKSVDAIYDGKILRPEQELDLEPNTRVRIRVEPIVAETGKSASFLEIARSLELSGPSDWSANLDYYLYGDNG